MGADAVGIEDLLVSQSGLLKNLRLQHERDPILGVPALDDAFPAFIEHDVALVAFSGEDCVLDFERPVIAGLQQADQAFLLVGG